MIIFGIHNLGKRACVYALGKHEYGILPAVHVSDTHGTQLHTYPNYFVYLFIYYYYKLSYMAGTRLMPKKNKEKMGEGGGRSLTLHLNSPSSVFFMVF